MFKQGKMLIIAVSIMIMIKPVLANLVKTFLPSKSLQITIDVKGFEPFDLFDQGTLLAGHTDDGIVVTITAEKVETGTTAEEVRKSHSQPTLSMFGKPETVEEADVNGIAVLMYRFGQPQFPKGIDEPFNGVRDAIKNKWCCNGYLVKDDVAFSVHLSGDICKYDKKKMLDTMRSFRIEPSTEIEEWVKLYDELSQESETQVDSIGPIQTKVGLAQDFIRKYPTNPSVQVSISSYYISTQQPELSRKACYKAIENHRVQPMMIYLELWECYYNLGIGFAISKDKKKALEYLNKAYLVARGQKNSQILALSTYNLACMYTENGDQNNGVKYLAEAVTLEEQYRETASTDSSFDKLKKNPKFNELILSKPKAEEMAGKTWSDEAKMWALGCSAILTERNHQNHDTLNPRVQNERNIKSEKELLEKWWGDSNREDLLESLDWLEKGGHRRRFEYLGALTDNLSKKKYNAILESKLYDLEELYEILIVKEHYPKLREKSILSWDYGRYICLCRWGYLVGWLSGQEAWERIMPAAKTMQNKFSSWEDMANNYLIGRMFWSYNETKDDGNLNAESVERLLEMKSSPWNKYTWSTKLDSFKTFPETEGSLSTGTI